MLAAERNPATSSNNSKRYPQRSSSLPQSDMFRFVGFVGTLVEGSSTTMCPTQRASRSTADAKEKFRRLARFFAETGYNFHLQATHDSTARQLLDVLEEVHAVTPFARQRIVFAHLEDATAETIARIKKLGGGICGAGPPGADRRAQRGALGLGKSAQCAAVAHDDRFGYSAGRRHGRLSLGELFADAVAVVADHRQDGGRLGDARARART